jgi:uncharacterized membrane protein HdeD (DUF308 family)
MLSRRFLPISPGRRSLDSSGQDPKQPLPTQEFYMIILGIILLIIGFVTKVAIIWSLGILALVIGLILVLLGAVGHAIGGRRHYW